MDFAHPQCLSPGGFPSLAVVVCGPRLAPAEDVPEVVGGAQRHLGDRWEAPRTNPAAGARGAPDSKYPRLLRFVDPRLKKEVSTMET